MKVLGKFIGEYNARDVAVGRYMAFEAEWIYVRKYSHKNEDKRCYLVVGTAYLIADIRKIDRSYLTPEEADLTIKRLVTDNILDLNEHNMGFFDLCDIRPDFMYVKEVIDEDEI